MPSAKRKAIGQCVDTGTLDQLKDVRYATLLRTARRKETLYKSF